MRECKTCGTVLDGAGRYRGHNRHERRCRKATPAERAHYKRGGRWPRAGEKVRPLPPEVPEPPPTGGAR